MASAILQSEWREMGSPQVLCTTRTGFGRVQRVSRFDLERYVPLDTYAVLAGVLCSQAVFQCQVRVVKRQLVTVTVEEVVDHARVFVAVVVDQQVGFVRFTNMSVAETKLQLLGYKTDQVMEEVTCLGVEAGQVIRGAGGRLPHERGRRRRAAAGE